MASTKKVKSTDVKCRKYVVKDDVGDGLCKGIPVQLGVKVEQTGMCWEIIAPSIYCYCRLQIDQIEIGDMLVTIKPR